MVIAPPMGRPGGNSVSSSSKRIETCPFNIRGNRFFCGWVIGCLPKKYKHPAASMKGKVSGTDNEKVSNSFNRVFGICSGRL